METLVEITIETDIINKLKYIDEKLTFLQEEVRKQNLKEHFKEDVISDYIQLKNRFELILGQRVETDNIKLCLYGLFALRFKNLHYDLKTRYFKS